MISAFIFFCHFIFILIIFTKKWQEESISAAWINILLIVILFAVGWSLSTMLVKIIFEPEGFGRQFDRDTIALTVLTIFEIFFYRIYYRGGKITEDGKEIQ